MASEFYAALRGGLGAKNFIPVAVSGVKRGEYLPDAPTAKEAGVANFEVTSWNAIFAPAGTPPDVINTLNKALNEVLADADVRKKALELGIDARGSTPQEIQARLKDDIAKWSAVIQKAGIEKR
jgi:tripartite-type tricarboxylate transporter receptor subunit TctC